MFTFFIFYIYFIYGLVWFCRLFLISSWSLFSAIGLVFLVSLRILRLSAVSWSSVRNYICLVRGSAFPLDIISPFAFLRLCGFSSGYYCAVRISRLCGSPSASSDVFLPFFRVLLCFWIVSAVRVSASVWPSLASSVYSGVFPGYLVIWSVLPSLDFSFLF